MLKQYYKRLILLFLLCASASFFLLAKGNVQAEKNTALTETAIFIRAISYPDWFSDSVLDLPTDLATAKKQGKRGIMIYFAWQECACCELLKATTFQRPDVIAYLSRDFYTAAVDIFAEQKGLAVIDFDGQKTTEKALAKSLKVEATPTLIFFDTNGKELYRSSGYQSPYEFLTLLDFIDGDYFQNLRLEDYRQQLPAAEWLDPFELHDERFFSPPPYYLNRSVTPGERPLAVFFETSDCPSCNLLHQHILQQDNLIAQFKQMEVAQLNAYTDTPLITPAGEYTRARQWAEQLKISYFPTVIFFDRHGREITRVDSIAELHQLAQTLPAHFPYLSPNVAAQR